MRLKRRQSAAAAAALSGATIALAVVIAPGAAGDHVPGHPACNDHEADVEISVARSPSKASYGVGEGLNIVVTATNHGPCPAPQAEITLTIPGGLTPGVASVSDGSYSQPKWTVDLGKEGDANNPHQETLTLPVTTNAAGTHIFEARLTDGHFTDPASGNDDASAAIVVVEGAVTTTTTTPTTSSSTTTTSATTTTTPTTTTTTTTTTTGEGPVEGVKINAFETTGEVLVKLPGQDPRPIDPDGELLPPGTEIDATNGTVVITSEYNGELEEMTFSGGAFKLLQTEGNNPVVVIELKGEFGNGSSVGAASLADAARKRGKEVRKLWGKGNKGHFRTRGRSGSATVRGTKWFTKDLRNGATKFKLKRGKLWINDFSTKKKIDKVLKGTGSYVVKPKPKRRR